MEVDFDPTDSEIRLPVCAHLAAFLLHEADDDRAEAVFVVLIGLVHCHAVLRVRVERLCLPTQLTI